MTDEQITEMLAQLDDYAVRVGDFYGLPLRESEMAVMIDIVKHHSNAPESKNKYRVDGIIYQGHQTLDEVMASLSGDVRMVYRASFKTIVDFEKDFIEAGVLNANETLIAVKALLATRKIAAIKLVRAHTNWGLKEAKEFVENI